jgi:hypothetical protein
VREKVVLLQNLIEWRLYDAEDVQFGGVAHAFIKVCLCL